MGGIFCYIGTQKAPHIVMEGLPKLKKHDYDSAGICSVERNKTHIRRSKGKLENLSRLLAAVPLWGTIAMGHIRIATHGRASEINAHPHKAGPVVLVHNGTIENFQELKNSLQSNDHTFKSETDSEVIAHLIEQKMYAGSGFEEAVHTALLELKGTFSICLVSETEPGVMIAAVHGSPLFVGCAGNEYFIASEMQPVLDHTSEIISLKDNEMAVFKDGLVRFSTITGGAGISNVVP
jgi:glucosamine--fructose-6-phosphate aminotransferase (isomerizing)